MAFTVYDRPESWTFDGSTATREYGIDWDTTGATNPYLARVALDTYLSGFAEHYTTHVIRDLNADGAAAFDPVNERLLSFYLHGLPVQPYDCNEIADSEGRYYTATVTWGSGTGEDGETLAPAEFLGVATVDPDDTPATFSTSLSASAVGRTIDFAPVVWAFVSGGAKATGPSDTTLVFPVSGYLTDLDERRPFACPFTLGSLGAEQPEASGPIVVNGLTYSAPPIDLTVTFNIKGKSILAEWADTMQMAAKRGVMNTDVMTINNIAYEPYTLMLGQFDISYENAGRGATTVTCGFSVGYLTDVEFTAVEDGWQLAADFLDDPINPETSFSRYETDFFDPIGSAHAGQAFNFSLWSETAPPLVEDVRVISISSLDYAWSFYGNYVVTSGPIPKISRKEYICVHRIWGEASFAALFGVDEL